MRIPAIFALVAACAAGCAMPPTYVPPPLAGNASIKVDLKGAGVVVYANGEDCSDPQIFSQADNPVLRSDRTFVVAANKRVALQVLWATGLGQCNVMVSMTPQANERYVLAGFIDGAAGDVGRKCHVSVRNADSRADSLNGALRLQQVAWTPSLKLNATCSPLPSP